MFVRSLFMRYSCSRYLYSKVSFLFSLIDAKGKDGRIYSSQNEITLSVNQSSLSDSISPHVTVNVRNDCYQQARARTSDVMIYRPSAQFRIDTFEYAPPK